MSGFVDYDYVLCYDILAFFVDIWELKYAIHKTQMRRSDI